MSRPSTPPPSASSSSTSTPSSSGSEPEDVLDLRGEVCPYTFVRTRLRLEDMPLGARLAILVDHEPAVRNIPRSARDWGQDVESVAPVAGPEAAATGATGPEAASAEAAGPALWQIVLRKRVP